ncbi:hypothetical protein JHK87_039472 [Glycine soja]|nr:hypothetical protein JHK87_039472 [Glycine soja]
MPCPEDANSTPSLDNSLILSELNYNKDETRLEFEHLFTSMTAIYIFEHLFIYYKLYFLKIDDRQGNMFGLATDPNEPKISNPYNKFQSFF